MNAAPLTKLAPLALGAFLVLGCRVNPGDPKLANSAGGSECKSPEAMLDDGDDNNNQTLVIGNRGGYWYTFSDMDGTEVWPTAGAKGGTFEMSPGGAENTPYAARFKGKVSTAESPTQAGMGMNFVDPKGGYDASKYGGISFWAKAGPGSVTNIRIKIPDNNTDPDGGVCSECFNDFGMDINLTREWKHYIVRFKDLSQLPGWGMPKKFSVDKSRLYGIQFQVNEKGKNFDIWVDQIRFTGCSGS
jgi:endoglucanase